MEDLVEGYIKKAGFVKDKMCIRDRPTRVSLSSWKLQGCHAPSSAMTSLPLDWMVSSLLAAAAEAEAAVLEAVEAEVLEEQPASERTPAAAMTLIREIKVLRFIGDDPFLFSMGNFLKELTGPCLFGMGEELLRGGFLDHDTVFLSLIHI